MNKEENGSTQNPSALKRCNSQTGYDFYHNKYENFIEHVRKVSQYYGPIKPWLDKLEGVSFDVFISVAESTIKSDQTPKQIIGQFSEDENFDINAVKAEDINKIERYIMLFKVMLADN